MEIFIIPPLVIAFLMYLFLYSFRNPEKIAAIPLIISMIIFGFLSAGMMWFASRADIAALLAVAAVFITTFVIVLAAIVLLVALPKKRKLMAVLVAIVCPAILFVSVQVGGANTPEIIYKRNADQIIKGLSNYHRDKGIYPSMLAELVPRYMADLNPPQRVWGWLYQTKADNFWLGYVESVTSVGYSSSIYSSDTAQWDFELHGTGPFALPPTPTNY